MGESLTPFPIRAWRQAVDDLAGTLGTEAIAPFGFELTESRAYLLSQLRYLFIYLSRSPRLPPPRELTSVVTVALGRCIPDVAGSIELIDCDRVTHLTGAAAPRTLIIRSIDNVRPLLDEWARYVVATALAGNREKITAVADFDVDLMAQRYCCQLAMIHDALFATLKDAPRVTIQKDIGERLRALQRIGLRERYGCDLVDRPSGWLIRRELERYYTELNAFLDQIDTPTATEVVPDFHSRQWLQWPSSPTIVAVTETARTRYLSYGA